jgi:Niemann-Pick C1 protein
VANCLLCFGIIIIFIYSNRIGFFCASYPLSVIFVCLIVCSALISGFALYFSVITDPVELWSPKNSDTRLNKNFYDSHFRPFYRTTQIIIRPTSTDYVLHDTFYQQQNFSAAFGQDFLSQVLDLQDQVTSLKAEVTVDDGSKRVITLEDICFAPLKPDNNKCTIQSVLNYYQNNRTNLYKVKPNADFPEINDLDYLDHFMTCVSSPTSVTDKLNMSCLGEYGGPVMPFVAFGGYPSTVTSRGYKQAQYGNASALIVTIIINNHNDEKLNADAEAWEKKMVEFMKQFQNPNMTISFSTERSIQDELNRESQSDVSTILISYAAMFLYITLTLGKLTS